MIQIPPNAVENDPKLMAALRMAAVEYTEAGWPILALTPSGDQPVAGMSPQNAHMAEDWWSQRPYGIGVRVGEHFDILEIPASVGGRLREQLHAPTPIFDVPLRGWFMLVSAGAVRIPELTPYRHIVHLHRRGTWLPLPPTRLPGGPALWISRGPIPHSLTIQNNLLPALRTVMAATTGSRYPLPPNRGLQ